MILLVRCGFPVTLPPRGDMLLSLRESDLKGRGESRSLSITW